MKRCEYKFFVYAGKFAYKLYFVAREYPSIAFSGEFCSCPFEAFYCDSGCVLKIIQETAELYSPLT